MRGALLRYYVVSTPPDHLLSGAFGSVHVPDNETDIYFLVITILNPVVKRRDHPVSEAKNRTRKIL
jgi:hypothetical protein